LEILSYVYNDKGDYKNALDYLHKYKELNKKNEKELSDRSTAEHELEIDLTNQKNKLEQNKTYSNLLAVGLLIFGLGFGYVVYSYRKQNKLNQLLEKNIQQKEDLLKEIHHRVKNNLSVISGLLELQSFTLKNDAFEMTFKESQNRVKSIALIHQRLYQHESVSSIELKEYINDLYKQIYNVFNSNKEVIFTNRLEKTMLDIDTAVPLGLILNELFTNSFKYAFKTNPVGAIIIELNTIEEGSYQLLYKDNGQGLEKDFDFKKVSSFGLKLVSRLCVQLFGKVKYEKTNDHSIFTIDFKDNVGKIKAEQ
jgi:two-component sensor histidine kinase